VRSVTLSGAGLFSGDGFGIRVGPEGYTPQPDEDVRALVVVAGPKFFSTLRIPLIAGREFSALDESSATRQANTASAILPRVAVVGESFARRYFGTTDVVGRTVRFGTNPQQPPLEIIGVAADIKYRTVREHPEMQLYVPYFGGLMSFPMIVRVATRSDPRAFASNVRALIAGIDSRVRVGGLRLMDDVVDETLMQERVLAQLGGFFSVFALGLASLGLYGLLAYAVVQRTREIGVRVALGARPGDVLALVVGQGAKLALAGMLIGIAAACVATRFVARLLYGVTPTDPVTLGGMALLLLLVATFAAWLPARRATRIDPMLALRSD
jgi:putative ABC transport system permease protein